MSDIQEPLPWGKSSATVAVLEQLVADRLLPRNSDTGAPAWISPHPDETEPKPPQGYVVSFVRLHERGFGVPVSRFMRALCDHYGAELHNFSPNAISQAAVFVAVCEGVPGDRGALGYLDPSVPRRALRRERTGPAEAVRARRRPDLPRAPLPEEPLRNFDGALPAFTGRVLHERPQKWDWGCRPQRSRTDSRASPTR